MNVSFVKRVALILLLVLTLNAIAAKNPALAAPQNGLVGALAKPYAAPELAGIETWLNSPPLTLAGLKGKVVLVDFWSYSCINCIRTLPYLVEWDQKYRDKGLVIIGVSSPEFEFEKNKSNVEASVRARHVTYPVALDNNHDTWNNFHNQYWPAHYLIDKNGQVVYTHFGEGDYAVTENNIRYLLGLNALDAATPDVSPIGQGQTPETYLGSNRAERFASSINDVPLHHWALSGKWRTEGQRIVAQAAGATLRLHFHAGKVFLVLGAPKGQVAYATLLLNGQAPAQAAGKDAPQGKLKVDEYRLYELIDQQGAKDGVLDITAQTPGLAAYAFTFGN